MSGAIDALSKKVQPTWKLLGLISLIVLATLKVIDLDHKFAIAAAQDVFAPHLEESKALRPVMMSVAKDLKESNDALKVEVARQSKNQLLICRKLDIKCIE